MGSVVAPPLQMFNQKAPQTSRPSRQNLQDFGARVPPAANLRHTPTIQPSVHPSIRSKAGRERTEFLDLRRRPRYPLGGGDVHGIRGTLAALALMRGYAPLIHPRPG